VVLLVDIRIAILKAKHTAIWHYLPCCLLRKHCDWLSLPNDQYSGLTFSVTFPYGSESLHSFT
jgi:hypothetical protein